jgi:hypothetical protein
MRRPKVTKAQRYELAWKLRHLHREGDQLVHDEVPEGLGAGFVATQRRLREYDRSIAAHPRDENWLRDALTMTPDQQADFDYVRERDRGRPRPPERYEIVYGDPYTPDVEGIRTRVWVPTPPWEMWDEATQQYVIDPNYVDPVTRRAQELLYRIDHPDPPPPPPLLPPLDPPIDGNWEPPIPEHLWLLWDDAWINPPNAH